MNVYISCAYNCTQELSKTLDCLRKVAGIKPVYNTADSLYDVSKLHQADVVVFVLADLKWSSRLENMPRGCLSELIYCINNKKSICLAYKSSKGVGIYGACLSEDLTFGGVAGTSDNIYRIGDYLETVRADDKVTPTLNSNQNKHFY